MGRTRDIPSAEKGDSPASPSPAVIRLLAETSPDHCRDSLTAEQRASFDRLRRMRDELGPV